MTSFMKALRKAARNLRRWFDRHVAVDRRAMRLPRSPRLQPARIRRRRSY
jgi:hypothetical protein